MKQKMMNEDDEVKNSIKKEFDNDPWNEIYQKAKVIYYNGKIHTNFHNNKILKEGCQCIYLSVILINSVFRIVSH